MSTVIHEQVERARRGEHPGVVARMRSGWAVLHEWQFPAGWCVLLADPVVGTLNDLGGESRRVFLEDMALLGDAVLRATGALRINYEMLGNQAPALHAHVVPRLESESEAMLRQPVWLYPASEREDPAHRFGIDKHEGLRRSIAGAIGAQEAKRAEGVLMWQRAASFAARAHAGQVRKDGATPYCAHPFRVAMTVRDVFGCDDWVCVAAALLHDTIEDTPVDYDDIAEGFGDEVARCVVAVTKDMRLAEAERERAYDEQIRAADWRAKLVKLADVYDNISDRLSRTDEWSARRLVDRAERAIALAESEREHPWVGGAIEAVRAMVGDALDDRKGVEGVRA
ncbi:MAG: HD domain-containing protein [Phycisphaeraceae bacterium]|nr:MAG: HD domain-containing protein [Phycisphaeraceae bacterium]